MRATIVFLQQIRCEREWNPRFGISIREMKICRHDADNRQRTTIELNRPVDYVWISPKPSLPKRIAEYHARVVACFILVRQEIPTELRLHAERGKQIRRDGGATQSLRLIDTGEIEALNIVG